MRVAWLEELLPRATASSQTTLFWLLFFGLFPLAYVGGVFLQVKAESPARISGAIDRATSIRIAERFASAKGFDVAGWDRFAIAETKDNLLAYYGEAKGTSLEVENRLAPAREVQVLFRPADGKHELRVYISLTGEVTGFDRGVSSGTRQFTSNMGMVQIHSDTEEGGGGKEVPKSESEEKAEAIARESLASNATLNGLVKLGPAKVSRSDEDTERSEVTWDASPEGQKELTLHVRVSVRDSKVVGQRIEANVARQTAAKKKVLPIFLNSVYGLFLTLGAIYAIYRYAKRTIQREVSHLRTLVVAAIFCVSFSVYVFSVGVDEVAVRLSGQIFSQITLISYVSSLIVFSIMGLLVGIAYGSGEGEVREAYAGKLTSLDALLAGRLFSKDVAVSLLCGAASAGWLLLVHHALNYFLQSDMLAFRSDVLRYTFARLPWLTLLLGKQYDALLVAVAGLLLPASFLLRRGVRKRGRFAWLILFALLSVLREAASYSTAGSTFLAIAVFSAALLLPFFAFDLLAAMVSLSALAYVNELARLSAVIPPWRGFAFGLAGLGAAIMLAAVYLALRGQRVREEDVRPKYAKMLAERMSMQAEILAAREAQLRLLPQAAPVMPGVHIAACCLPARGLGGDFYDFFKLDANRVGIFVAQGSEQGLVSALRIALAKGVLMHASLQPHSPLQIALALESSIADLLGGGSAESISFAYGVMDGRRNLLNYARVGASPRLLIYREGLVLAGAAQLERVIAVPSRSKTAPQMHEGSASVQEGDHIVFFTEGVTSLKTRRFGRREHQWMDILLQNMGQPDEALEASLINTLLKYQEHAPNDLTAVVVRVKKDEAMAQQVVA